MNLPSCSEATSSTANRASSHQNSTKMIMMSKLHITISLLLPSTGTEELLPVFKLNACNYYPAIGKTEAEVSTTL